MARHLPVPADLQAWVEAAVVVRTDDALPCSRFPALNGSQLVVRVAGHVHGTDGRALPAAALLGPSAVATRLNHHGAVHAVGLVLWPHAAPVLLGCEGRDLAHQTHDLHDLLGPRGADLHEAVHDAADDDARVARLLAWVRQRVQAPQATEQLARRLRMAQAVCAGTDTAPHELGLSRRQLQRRFLQDFGLAPKPFQTVQRLKATLHDAVVGRLDGAALALQHGYYDQSHLARDLRRLAGAPLASLRGPALARQPEHWALQLRASSLS